MSHDPFPLRALIFVQLWRQKLTSSYRKQIALELAPIALAGGCFQSTCSMSLTGRFRVIAQVAKQARGTVSLSLGEIGLLRLRASARRL